MADPKGIYFGQGNRGFATILPDKRNATMPEIIQEESFRNRALAAKQKDYRREDLASIKNFDTYRYYNPVMSQAYEDLVNYVKQPGYDQGEFLIKKNELAQLSQAQMQLKDYDELAFKEYDDDKRILDDVKAAYVNKYRSNATMEGLMEAAKSTPDKTFFLKEVGGSQFLNESESFKAAIDTVFTDWMTTSVEGLNLMRKRYGNAINMFTTEQLKTKAKAFARYDEATGQIVAMNPDELIQAGVLDAFQEDPYTRRIIEDKAIALHKESGADGPVPDNLRAEVLKTYLDPRAGMGEVDRGTRNQIAGDYYSEGEQDRKSIAMRLYDRFESLMDKKALPGDRDPLFKGMEFNDYKLGDIVVEDSGTYVEYKEKVPVIMDGVNYGDEFVDRKDPLTMDIIYKLFPSNIAAKFEKIAREKKRVGETGQFISKQNTQWIPRLQEKENPSGSQQQRVSKPRTVADLINNK